jgi:1-acyl-sn-glycerol-3-phosphate acyltransferase
VRHWARQALGAARVRIRSEGLEHVRDAPFLVVANHGSMLDIPALFAALPLQFRFVSRPFFFHVPVMGWGMRAAGQISLDPKRPREAAEALRALRSRFDRKISVLLFPEGTRTRDGALQRYKRGPFLTAIRNGVPILPVAMRGLHEALPPGRFVAKPGEARLVVGAPIPTAGLPEGEAEKLARSVEAWTRETLERLAGDRSPA